MKKWIAPLMLTLLFLGSCSESSLFLGEVEEPAQLELSTVPSGSILESGSEVSVRIRRDSVYTGDESTVDVLVVELLDHLETVLAEQRFEAVDEATTLPPVELPELPDGLYKLRLTYYDGEDTVAQESSHFFVASGSYEIVGLSAYPASSYPEADGLLRVSLDVPPGSDPFLVWRLNDRDVASGYLSETGATVAVLSPASEGVFPVQVDLYPVLPEGVDPEEVEPATSYSAELFVSNSPAPARTDLLPETSYFALYHLRGSLRDTGVRASWFPSRDFAAEPLGSPELAAASTVFGYELDGASALEMPGAVWPVIAEKLSPVSMSFRLMAHELTEQMSLMRVELGTTDLISVLVDGSGRLGVTLPMLASEVWTPVPVLAAGVPETITVSIVPGEEQGSISFFAGGQLVSTEDVGPITLEQLDSPRLVSGADRWAMIDGTTYLGALEDGFRGVLDEFGVFFRDEANRPTTNTSLFQDSMRSQYGDRLIYAASFEEEEADAVLASEQVEVTDGAIVVGRGGRVLFQPFFFEEEDLVVRLELELPVAATLELREPVAEGQADAGSASDDSEPYATVELAAADGEQTVELVLRHREGKLTITRDGATQVLQRSVSEFRGVALAVTVAAEREDRPHADTPDDGEGSRTDAGAAASAGGAGETDDPGEPDVADESDESGAAGDSGEPRETDDSGERGDRAAGDAGVSGDGARGAPGDGTPDDAAATAARAHGESVRVLSVVARRDRPQIPDRLFDVSNE